MKSMNTRFIAKENLSVHHDCLHSTLLATRTEPLVADSLLSLFIPLIWLWRVCFFWVFHQPLKGFAMGRFESGRDLRAKFYAKFSKVNFNHSAIFVPVPDIGWPLQIDLNTIPYVYAPPPLKLLQFLYAISISL
jgi:hypothetical protein